MTDIREQILQDFITEKKKGGCYEIMDEYAIKILQFLIDNEKEFDFIGSKEPATVILNSIKRHLK